MHQGVGSKRGLMQSQMPISDYAHQPPDARTQKFIDAQKEQQQQEGEPVPSNLLCRPCQGTGADAPGSPETADIMKDVEIADMESQNTAIMQPDHIDKWQKHSEKVKADKAMRGYKEKKTLPALPPDPIDRAAAAADAASSSKGPIRGTISKYLEGRRFGSMAQMVTINEAEYEDQGGRTKKQRK